MYLSTSSLLHAWHIVYGKISPNQIPIVYLNVDEANGSEYSSLSSYEKVDMNDDD